MFGRSLNIGLFIALVVICFSCTLSDQDITTRKWKFLKGDRPESGLWTHADAFAFGAGVFKLSHDTISLLDSAVAVIVNKRKGNVFGKGWIEVKLVKTGNTCLYEDAGPVAQQDTTYKFEIHQVDLVAPPIPPDPPAPPGK